MTNAQLFKELQKEEMIYLDFNADKYACQRQGLCNCGPSMDTDKGSSLGMPDKAVAIALPATIAARRGKAGGQF